MRILYLADVRFPLERANGIQSMETCHALASRGHDVTLVVRPDTQQPPRDPYAFYGLPRIPSLTIEIAPVTGPAAARRVGYLTYAIGRAAGRARQDAIFTRDLGLASLLLRLPPAVRAPVVYEAHGLAAESAAARPALLTGGAEASPSKIARLRARDARVWRRADGYVTITRGLAEELQRQFGPRDRLAVIPDGVRLRGTTPAPRLAQPADAAQPDRKTVLGYAGHLYPWKGVDLIVEIVTALQDTRAVIIGGHPQETDAARVLDLARQLDCASRVEITGLVPPSEVAARLQAADVLVLPNPASAISTAFTSPLKLFEYMASGRPIVASDLPSIREVLQHERNALLAEAGNPSAFVAAVRRLIEDPALGARLAGQAIEDVQAYTWDARAAKIEALLQQVIP